MAKEAGEGKGSTTRILSFAGLIISLIAGTLGLLFTLKPEWKPCLGDTDASFTGAPAFPRVAFRDHLVRTGSSREEAAQEPNLIGAEIRFSYRTSGFRGENLPLTWSLLSVGRDGTLGAVARGQDRALAMTVSPRSCSSTGGKDLFIEIPQPGRHYQVVLELYRDRNLRDRVALTQTDVFRG
jgi:hypothetical protein